MLVRARQLETAKERERGKGEVARERVGRRWQCNNKKLWR